MQNHPCVLSGWNFFSASNLVERANFGPFSLKGGMEVMTNQNTLKHQCFFFCWHILNFKLAMVGSCFLPSSTKWVTIPSHACLRYNRSRLESMTGDLHHRLFRRWPRHRGTNLHYAKHPLTCVYGWLVLCHLRHWSLHRYETMVTSHRQIMFWSERIIILFHWLSNSSWAWEHSNNIVCIPSLRQVVYYLFSATTE